MQNNNLDNFKYYDLYDPEYNAEGLNLEEIDKELETQKKFYRASTKKSRPLITKRIKELTSDKHRIENHKNNKSIHLVGFCSFSNEIFKLARRLARTKNEEKRNATQEEIATLIHNLNDREFVDLHRTTKIIALRRIGILMTTEENENVLKELKENLYHLQEVKEGFLNPYKYYKEINNRDFKYSARQKEVIHF